MVDACAWKSDKDLVPQDQIEWLLSLLLEAEKRRWLASISPVNSAEHDELQPEDNEKRNYSFVDAGSHLLRTGGCIGQIHNSFHRYEQNHYCLEATRNNNPDRPSSQIKVVSNEGSYDRSSTDSTRTSIDTQETARGLKSRVFAFNWSLGTVGMKRPSFDLYKNVLLCAKYPVLSESLLVSPNTPYSPALSPSTVATTSVQQRKFLFSKPLNSSSVPTDAKLKSHNHPMSASSDGCVSPEVSLPNSSEVLQELVMNVFSLKKLEQKYFSGTLIPQQVPLAREPQRLLVKELRSQRLVLERNHHPFYSVQAFMNKNAYSEWVILEKEKIECLIRSCCPNTSPEPQSELPLGSEFHEQYVDLMKKLIRYENKTAKSHPVHGGVTPKAPLSPKACKLLKEFELRYGVGLLFCKICYLDYLVKYLENHVWYIQHVTVCLQDVMDHVLTSCPEIYVEKEFKMLLSILSNLLGKVKYSLTRIRRIFPENSPMDGVPKLVALFKLSLDSGRLLQSEFPEVFSAKQMAQEFARNLPTEPLEDLLASYLKTEMEDRYERLKVIVTDNLGRNFSAPQLLLNVILEIRQEVKDYNASYKMAFSSYFEIKELAAIKFYSLLMSDVELLCANPRRALRGDAVETIMLCLAFRLSKLDKDWAKFIPLSNQIWRQSFQEFALQWLDAIGRYFETLVPQLISHDVWRATEVNITGSQHRTHRRRQGKPIPRGPIGAKSASLLTLTPSKNSAFKTVGPSTNTPAKTNMSEKQVDNKRGKEPLHPRKYTLGSSPPLRTRSPKRTRPDMRYESSSDEDTPSTQHTARSRSPPKANHVQHVVAQIHEPKAKADSNAKVKSFQQPSLPEESTMEVTSVTLADDLSKDKSSTSAKVNPETNNGKTDSEGSKMEQSSNNMDPDSVEHPSCSAQNQHALKADDNEGEKPQQNDVSSQSGNESCVVQPIKIEIQPEFIDESDVNRISYLNQSQDSTEKVAETSASTESPANGIVQLCGNGNHSEDAPCGGTLQALNNPVNHTRPKLDQQEESVEKVDSSASVCTSDAQEDFDEVLLEGGFSSDCSGHSNGSETPFENDSTDESDGNTLTRTSGSFQIPENDSKVDIPHGKGVSVDGASTNLSSLPDGHQQKAQGDPDDGSSEFHPVRKLGFVSIAQAVKPVEDGVKSIEEQSGSYSCQTCPARNRCGESGKNIGYVEGGQGSDDNKQSTTSTCLKGAQPRQSAPVNIPATGNNKLVTRLLDTPSCSVGSMLSECGTFVTAAGSARSGNSIESFHTARSKSSSLQSHQSRSKENTGDHSDKECSTQPGKCRGTDGSDDHSDTTRSADHVTPKVFPVSSSFVDVICAVNRLVAFVCHLCEILCPDESLQREEHAAAVDDELRNESLHVKRRLCSRLIQVILSFVKLYSDNVVAMETCGLPEELLTEILDERVQRNLRLQREAGRLQGCRYNPLARQCCNTRDSSGMFIPPCEGISQTETNPGQYEPLTQQMGVRISSVAILRSILPWLQEYVTTSVNNHDSTLSAHHRYESSTESELSYSLSYCEYGPSLDGVTTTHSTAEAARCSDPPPRTDELHEPGILNGDMEHLCRLQTAQVKLVTYRINKFFKQVFRYLLDLNLPRYTIKKRLRPAMEFLSSELRRFHGVLYSDCFNKLLSDFWSALVGNFEEESHRLVRRKSSASEHSKLLLQAVAYLIQYFHARGDGLPCDQLATLIDAPVKHLQLYTSPTDTLISMYHSFYKHVLIMQRQYRVDEFASSASVSSHQASANAPADFVIQALSKELHAIHKCFTGAQLVEWVKNYVHSNGLDNLGVCIGNTETETGLELGQYLLDNGIVMCVSPPPLFNQHAPVERSRQDEPVLTTPTERGQVFISDEVPPDIRINNITVTNRSSRASPASNSRSTSRSTAVDDSESQDEADDEYEEGDFLGSGSQIWNRLNSALSEHEATFFNHPKAFYKFICEEDTSRTEIKLRLGITDRLNLPSKLKHILCVLYSRIDSDRNALVFLRRLPRVLLDEALDRGEAMCRPVLRVCQTL